MLTQTFGEMLFCPESECLVELPTPEELKHRIIVSTKPPKEYLEAKGSDDKRNDSQREKDSDDDVWGQEPSSLTGAKEDNDKVCHKSSFLNHILSNKTKSSSISKFYVFVTSAFRKIRIQSIMTRRMKMMMKAIKNPMSHQCIKI